MQIRRDLTPLAASGLVIIMIGATAITAMGGSIAGALFPLIVGLLAGCVAYGRWRPGVAEGSGKVSAVPVHD